MNLLVNGDAHQFIEGTLSLSELIERLRLSGQPLVVELNGQALLGREHQGIRLKDGDRIEIVRIVAGG
jgi:thiamine biosynthesis protein ThiS